MARYVSEEEFIKRIKPYDTTDKMDKALYNFALNKITETPTKDVAPVVHAKWIEHDDGWGDIYYDCSACNESWTTIEGTPFDNGMKYCPHCGAKMG